MPVSGINNNRYDVFEYDEEEECDEIKEDEDEDENVRKADVVKDENRKEIFDFEDVEDMSLDNVEEIIFKWNESCPEEGLCDGMQKYQR